jgi:hypothetical protein
VQIPQRIPSKGLDIQSLVTRLFEKPQIISYPLIRTAALTGYFCGQNLITRLKPSEARLISLLDKRIKDQSEKYRNTQPLNLQSILPQKLSIEIEKAVFWKIKAEKQTEKMSLVLVSGNGFHQLLESRTLLTAYKRHPKASWFFAASENYWKQPVILIEQGGFFDGGLLAVISPVNTEHQQEISDKKILKATRELKIEGAEYIYEKEA